MERRVTCPDRIRARLVFPGGNRPPLDDHVIEIAAGRVAALRPAGPDDPAPLAEIAAPGFIDLQINGAADVLFNDDPSVAALDRIAAGARQGGTAHLLPTFITAPGQDYRRAMAAVRAAIAADRPGILGLHLEGPFLSPRRPGIHDPAAIRPLAAADVEALTAPFPGPLLLTLAPEEQAPDDLARLDRAGVILFAGHSEARADCIGPARGATHLWNAMPPAAGREPGIVGAVLDRGLYAGIIADGHHVDWANIRIAARLLPDRLCLVTDAMPTLAGRRDSFELHGRTIRLAGGRLTDAGGTLAGAQVAMDQAVAGMVRHGGLGLGQALHMASGNPAAALRQADLGHLDPGARASVTLLGADLSACGVIVDGALLRP